MYMCECVLSLSLSHNFVGQTLPRAQHSIHSALHLKRNGEGQREREWVCVCECNTTRACFTSGHSMMNDNCDYIVSLCHVKWFNENWKQWNDSYNGSPNLSFPISFAEMHHLLRKRAKKGKAIISFWTWYELGCLEHARNQNLSQTKQIFGAV